MEVIFGELRQLVGVAPLTGAQIACFIAYLITLILLAFAEANRLFSARDHSVEKDEERETLNKKPQEAAGEKNANAAPEAARSFWAEVASCGIFKCLQLDMNTLSENRRYILAAAEFGTLMAWFFVADRTALLPEGSKNYTRDTFFFIYGLLVIYSFSTFRREWKTPLMLNRHQTEEWKGWMQVLFLLYHYFEARELYNLIRVLIAAYVWMTGFGNFLYYYKTRDFSIGRFAEMMWRLNFLVVFCCFVMNNSYMLYYICPMHTLFTWFVYAALAVFPHFNDSRLYLFGKIVACVAVVAVVWEFKPVFYTVWAPFRWLVRYTDPRRPGDDEMHEWFFRSGLDRYIWVHGMLCGFLHPYMDSAMNKLDSMGVLMRYLVRAAVLAACGLVLMAWYSHIYVLPKLEYNAIHPYTSWIPITVWMIARNILPRMRVVSLGIFGWLGCITLETYIGQFHTWLSTSIPDGQPVNLLVFLPEYSLLNFMLVTAVYVYVSHRFFQLTNTLKQAAIPGRDTFKVGVNCFVIAVTGVLLWTAGLMISTAA
uniref:Acetyltransferase-related family protein n=1 Tax=Tetraselmis sp. GSL018 TaxID=582737 RepID=A0A061S981_9CHLO|mmetsp:Transcript_6202/g.14903  ORF Transcript_6202/g.14903 Transcript_6202/m.14903 type:complete len:538 (-) Transcript_6202:430-2043(-)